MADTYKFLDRMILVSVRRDDLYDILYADDILILDNNIIDVETLVRVID